MDGVVERAKAGKLTTEGVIGRALLNDMVRSIKLKHSQTQPSPPEPAHARTSHHPVTRAALSQVDPKQIPDCKALSSVLNIDREADAELKAVNSKLSKLSKAAAKNAGDDPSPDQIKIAETLKDALAISNTAEKRVADRVMLIDGRFNVECVAG